MILNFTASLESVSFDHTDYETCSECGQHLDGRPLHVTYEFQRFNCTLGSDKSVFNCYENITIEPMKNN